LWVQWWRKRLHEAKTRLIEFGRYAVERRKARNEGRPETFDFPVFTHVRQTLSGCALHRARRRRDRPNDHPAILRPDWLIAP
jgi:hypothetical protein